MIGTFSKFNKQLTILIQKLYIIKEDILLIIIIILQHSLNFIKNYFFFNMHLFEV